ncbi:MAG: methylmalonyl-CoA mutase small subunit, partial [Bacteroidales bacterium]|nr:methylmalonyl-CoA mutase small subunit [Bacteroidales bacterium]
YLTHLTERNLSVDEVAPRIRLEMATGPDYFMEIARLRAARLLWARIVKAYGTSSEEVTKADIHCTTSSWSMTLYDRHVNMLRSTTEAMSAILGGCSSLTVLPFDHLHTSGDEFGERIARNQQLLLKEESYLDRVADPAAGSYFIENLTDSLITHAWKLFLEVQEKGGFLEAFHTGFIQEWIRESAAGKLRNLAVRKETLLGTNHFPNSSETLARDIPSSLFNPENLTAPGAETETLRLFRGGQMFETLRYQTDIHALKSGRRPSVMLLPLGNVAMRRARAQFAGNFFAVAGFTIIDHPGFRNAGEAVEAFRNNPAEIAVICSSDVEYPAIVPPLFEKLKNDTIVVVAGYPKESAEELKMMGIRHFIHLRSDIPETLSQFQKELGIIP